MLLRNNSNSHSKKRVRIAIPSNDGINIFNRMLGMAKEIYIYEVENGANIRFIEKRANPYENTMQHLKTLAVYEIIGDCKIIISAKIGGKGIERLRKRGIKLIFSKGNIQEALAQVLEEEAL